MIQGFWQTDPRLILTEEHFGCALLSSCYIAPQDFTPEDVNNLYKALLGVAFVDEESKILDWDKVVWSISPVMRFKEKAGIGRVCAVNEREILKWHLSNINSDHFTVGNGASKTVWDSMNRPDIMAKYATFVEKVIIKIGGQA